MKAHLSDDWDLLSIIRQGFTIFCLSKSIKDLRDDGYRWIMAI